MLFRVPPQAWGVDSCSDNPSWQSQKDLYLFICPSGGAGFWQPGGYAGKPGVVQTPAGCSPAPTFRVSSAVHGLKALLTGRFYKGDRPADIYTSLHRWQLCVTHSFPLTALRVPWKQTRNFNKASVSHGQYRYNLIKIFFLLYAQLNNLT